MIYVSERQHTHTHANINTRKYTHMHAQETHFSLCLFLSLSRSLASPGRDRMTYGSVSSRVVTIKAYAGHTIFTPAPSRVYIPCSTAAVPPRTYTCSRGRTTLTSVLTRAKPVARISRMGANIVLVASRARFLPRIPGFCHCDHDDWRETAAAEHGFLFPK